MPPFSPHHWHSRDKDNKYFWSLFRILANYTAIKFHLAVIWAEVRYIELLMVSSLPLFHLRHRLLLALRPYCVWYFELEVLGEKVHFTTLKGISKYKICNYGAEVTHGTLFKICRYLRNSAYIPCEDAMHLQLCEPAINRHVTGQ